MSIFAQRWLSSYADSANVKKLDGATATPAK